MSARIVKLPVAATSEGRTVSRTLLAGAASQRFLFWHGASGQRYVHTAYSLVDCPELPAANYILVKIAPEGRRLPLRIGRVTHRAPSLNLAELRLLGAQLGADEVHVHLLAADASQARAIELDLQAGQFQVLSPTARSRTLH